MTQTYSDMDMIPTGHASENLIDGCLVLEGGAFRGLYTQGFLDAMMICGINLSCVIGVSAGALSGLNYVSGQIGRSARINLRYRHDSRYVGVKALIHSHSIVDVGFLTEDRGIIDEPLDTQRLYRPEQRFIAVATNCLNGKTTLFEKGKCGGYLMEGVRASATMPYISPMVTINGTPYLDGGCSCAIPHRWAMKQGYRKIIVIRTRDIAFRKGKAGVSPARRIYRHYPALAEKLTQSNLRYDRQCDEVERLHRQGRLLRLAPSEPVKVGRVEPDVEKLGKLYWLGHTDFLAKVDEIRAYLAK
jgi:Predicted esterase of the alpha-beta hydrolase superfamily